MRRDRHGLLAARHGSSGLRVPALARLKLARLGLVNFACDGPRHDGKPLVQLPRPTVVAGRMSGDLHGMIPRRRRTFGARAEPLGRKRSTRDCRWRVHPSEPRSDGAGRGLRFSQELSRHAGKGQRNVVARQELGPAARRRPSANVLQLLPLLTPTGGTGRRLTNRRGGSAVRRPAVPSWELCSSQAGFTALLLAVEGRKISRLHRRAVHGGVPSRRVRPFEVDETSEEREAADTVGDVSSASPAPGERATGQCPAGRQRLNASAGAPPSMPGFPSCQPRFHGRTPDSRGSAEHVFPRGGRSEPTRSGAVGERHGMRLPASKRRRVVRGRRAQGSAGEGFLGRGLLISRQSKTALRISALGRERRCPPQYHDSLSLGVRGPVMRLISPGGRCCDRAHAARAVDGPPDSRFEPARRVPAMTTAPGPPCRSLPESASSWPARRGGGEAGQARSPRPRASKGVSWRPRATPLVPFRN